ncbi:MAG: hypothetical protein ACRDGH_13345, partial [Candidatus Limnocylindria bacterium]
MSTETAGPTTLTVDVEVRMAVAIRRGYGGAKTQTITLDLDAVTDEDRAHIAARYRPTSSGANGHLPGLILDEPTVA